MILSFQFYLDVYKNCYTDKSNIIFDQNIKMIMIQLDRSSKISSECSQFPVGVRVNLTIAGKNIDEMMTSTISNYSYLATDTIIINNVNIDILSSITSAQLDIYTYGAVTSVTIGNLLTQNSNLEECYYRNSSIQIDYNQQLIHLFPTGYCKIQLVDKLESVMLSVNGIQYNVSLSDFDYTQQEQLISLNIDLSQFLTQSTTLNVFLNFVSHGVEFNFQIKAISSLNNIYFKNIYFNVFNNVGMMGFEIDNFELLQEELSNADETIFKVFTKYYELQARNINISSSSYIIEFNCNDVTTSLRQECLNQINRMSLNKIFFNLLILKNNKLQKYFTSTVNLIETCWNRGEADYNKNGIMIKLYPNNKCVSQLYNFKLTISGNISENQQVLNLQNIKFSNQLTEIFFEGKLKKDDEFQVIMEMSDENSWFTLIISHSHYKNDKIVIIVAASISTCFLLHAVIDSGYGVISALKFTKRIMKKKSK